jgi:hypothetical protein
LGNGDKIIISEQKGVSTWYMRALWAYSYQFYIPKWELKIINIWDKTKTFVQEMMKSNSALQSRQLQGVLFLNPNIK